MWLKLVLATILVASVAAQLGCIKGASPSADGTKCRCDSGKEGHPDLCCYTPATKKGCHVAGDPVLTSFTNKKIGLDFPCGTMITNARLGFFGGPQVRVFVASKEMKNGAFYTSEVKIEITELVTITLTFNFDLNPMPIHQERSDSSQVADFAMADRESRSLYSDGITGDLKIDYDAAVNVYHVSLGDNFDIYIRAPAKSGPITSGVCVVESLQTDINGAPDSFACSLNKDLSNGPLGQYLDRAIQPMKNYMFNTATLKKTTSAQYADMCQDFQDNVVGKCKEADRDNAMKKCAFIMFQPTIRRCFHEAGTGDGRVMKAFLYCLATYCQGTKQLCNDLKNDERFKKCGPNLMDCDTWPPYREANKFVAGEGDNVNFGEGENTNQAAETTPFNFLGGGILGENGGQSNNNNNNNGGNDGGFNPADFF